MILVLGYFWGGNAGDMAILELSLKELSVSHSNTTILVPTPHPEKVQERYKAFCPNLKTIDIGMRRAGPLRFLSRNVRSYFDSVDLVVVTAGVMFGRNLFNLRKNCVLSILGVFALLPKRAWKLAFCVGVYDNGGYLSRVALRALLARFDKVVVRDSTSFDFAREVRKDVLLGADIAFSINANRERRGGSGAVYYVGVNIVNIGDVGASVLIQFLEDMKQCQCQRRLAIRLVSFSASDNMGLEKILSAAGYDVEYCSMAWLNLDEMLSELKRMDVFIVSRYHSAILCSKVCEKFYLIPYHEKVLDLITCSGSVETKYKNIYEVCSGDLNSEYMARGNFKITNRCVK